MLKDWHIEDPLGEMLKLVGALNYPGGAWKIAGRRGYFYTGLSRVKREHGKNAWIAVLPRLTKEECRRLVASGYARSDQFRRMGPSCVGLQVRVNPSDVSALQLLEYLKALDSEGHHLMNISAALEVAENVSALVGQDSAAQSLLPTPSRTVVSHWNDECGWLTDGEGSLTNWSWDETRSLVRSGAQDGFRVDRTAATLRIAAALGATSYLIEECLPRPDAPSVLDLSVRAFAHELNKEMAETLGVDENAGQRRLFHVEHTLAHGAAVYVFDAWRRRLVHHDKMSALLCKAIRDSESEEARKLSNVAFLYHFECQVGRLGNPPN